MPFTNPIIAGGETLIRSGIKSPNYSPDPPAGWRISSDGSVDFKGSFNLNTGYITDLTILGTATMSAADIYDLRVGHSLQVNGDPVVTQSTLPTKPRVRGESDTGSLPPNNAYAFAYYLTLPIPPAFQLPFARLRFRCSGNFSKNVGSGGASYLQYYWAANVDPTINSPMFAASERDSTYPAGVLPYSIDTYFDADLATVPANNITVGVLISNVNCAAQFVPIIGKAAFTAELVLEEYSATAAIPNNLRKVQ